MKLQTSDIYDDVNMHEAMTLTIDIIIFTHFR